MRMKVARFVGVVAAVALGLGLALSTAVGGAIAHNYLVSSTPAPDSVQSEPLDSVVLEFNDIVMSLDVNTSFVEVTGPDGATTHFETACSVTQDRTVTAPVTLGDPGTYDVVWQIVSADGHVVSDTQSFDYAPPAGTPAAAGAANTPCPSSEAPADDEQSQSEEDADAAPDAPSDAETSGIDSSVVIGAGIAVVGLAIIGVLVVIVVSRRSKGSA